MTGYSEKDLHLAAAAGVRAPSLHNSQPWLFRLHDAAIEVLADPSRVLPVVDHDGWATRIACGAATYNARLALAAAGHPASVALHPAPGVLARLTPADPRPPTYAEQELHDAIPRRHSHRGPFWPDPVPAPVRVRLIAAARDEDGWLDLLVGTTAVNGFAEIAQSADRVLRRDTTYQAALASLRGEVPVSAGAPLAEPYDLLPQRLFNDRPRANGRDYEPEPLIGILGSPGNLPMDHTVAGQALQKVLLTAVASGLDTSMISQPIEVPAARDQLRRSLGRTGFPQIAVRLGYGTPGRPTPRRELTEVVRDFGPGPDRINGPGAGEGTGAESEA
ncbi:nitroreductase [Actinoplanes sp. KI2]|uniref:Acg family FMN-binding oxidoreductase n=1 Tax=Actinoplanes sp. KI2 TaxID=2983315 RepID=UPI0021D61273|nr:nitroreductase [Actinoplanes sp. KI2]MCU7726958.1 nitroreductase [Actinoplanes sp. KI2]